MQLPDGKFGLSRTQGYPHAHTVGLTEPALSKGTVSFRI